MLTISLIAGRIMGGWCDRIIIYNESLDEFEFTCVY